MSGYDIHELFYNISNCDIHGPRFRRSDRRAGQCEHIVLMHTLFI